MNDSMTFLAALVRAVVETAVFNKNDQVPPAAVLWPDKERQWEPLLSALRKQLAVLTLGDYAPAEHTGPATYLRCMLGGTLDDHLDAESVPILYLPGVSRQELRAVEDCPKPLQPLAELQYRGVFFSHKNGRDWTIAGFLQSADGGLSIPVASDAATKEAVQRALLKLAYEPVAHLRNEAPLRAAFFDALLNPDEVRRLLKWMNDPQGYPGQIAPQEWTAFCALCNSKYGFHPVSDGPVTAAEKLGARFGAWATVWDRFEEAPEAYPNLPALLRQSRPQQFALFDVSPTWPQDNDSLEDRLRDDLLKLHEAPTGEARQAILSLEERHAERRQWVWAKLGRAPLALALKHLATLARVSEKPLGGGTVATVANAYAEWGWQVDAAVLDVLAAVETAADAAAVKAAILPLYRPWLEGAAKALQQVAISNPQQDYVIATLPPVEPGTCVVFCDALRFDLGQRLATALQRRGLACQASWRLAPLPPVTSTAKPAVSPVAGKIAGKDKHDLVPVSIESGTNVSVMVLRNLLESDGFQVLHGDALGDPAGRAWTEFGAIDRYGHDHGWKIAHHAIGELAGLADRIEALLRHGWKQVKVVTDHGWLLLPNGLPKADLKQHLTHARKGRCAVLKEGAESDQLTVPWHWDHDVCIAVASGIRCYEAGKEYEHGGISPQECVVPSMTVTQASSTRAQSVVVKSVSWKGLRCTVQMDIPMSELRVDIRTKAGDPATSLMTSPKPVEADGQVSLLVENEDYEGSAAMVVILDVAGAVQAQVATAVGG